MVTRRWSAASTCLYLARTPTPATPGITSLVRVDRVDSTVGFTTSVKPTIAHYVTYRLYRQMDLYRSAFKRVMYYPSLDAKSVGCNAQ